MANEKDIGGIKIRIGGDAGGIQRAGSAAERALHAVNVRAVAVGSAVGIILADLVRGFAHMASAAIKFSFQAIDSQSKLAQSIGLTTEELGRLGHAADLSGVSMESMGTFMGRLARAMSDAASGAKNAASDAFSQLGVRVTDANGALRGSEEVMYDLADRFAGMENGAQKTALAIEIFGRSGAQLIPLLNGGAAGLRDAGDEAERLGLVFSQQTGRDIEAFNDNLTRMQKMVQGVAIQVAANLAPHLADLSTKLYNAALDSGILEGAVDALIVVMKSLASAAIVTGAGVMSVAGAVTLLWEATERRADGAMDNLEFLSSGFNKLGDDIRGAIDLVGNLWQEAESGPTSIVVDNPGVDVGGGRGAGRMSQKLVDDMSNRLEALRDALRTEEEAELFSYETRLADLGKFLLARMIKEGEYNDLLQRAKQEHEDALLAIRERAMQEEERMRSAMVGGITSILQSISSTMDSEGDKQIGIQKAISAAIAAINVAEGITKALTLPPPLNFIQAAAVAAAGVAQLANINSATRGGGTVTSPSGGGGAPAQTASSDPDRVIRIQGLNPGDLVSGEMVIGIMGKIAQLQRDGYRLA